ncbi:C2H2-type zinc finger protein [Kluyveromyces lactis]|uniref:Transcription factor STP1 n=1 Tax=Kluyveromyces lactis (strain ATCC 8585 / CBS 2359 / DSM 70799 / NBRC 1267 / NRRL Y-1140 / WM37) TaxID=284590 RepID=Q6CKJ9_KLULA|nr:uncharacterized protein KLLA0_F10109g [Kluyveromyces lactis]CAG98248.1 KLLA0F10109p [Kluyveromyces lactis]|eukprot:XP_455540.1 uncharacterized protein KLLA0_F10109g [Kluyveromyces lactis]
MPSVQLLDTDKSILKRLSWRLTNWFNAIASHVVGVSLDCKTLQDDSSMDVRNKGNKSDFETEDEDEGEDGKLNENGKNSQEDTDNRRISLFPSSHNVDRQLEYNASVIPCSLNINGLQSPMSVARTPEGQMEWKMTIDTDPVTSKRAFAQNTSPKVNEDRETKTTQDITPKTDATPETGETSANDDSKTSLNDHVDVIKSEDSSVGSTPEVSSGIVPVSSTDSESQVPTDKSDEKKETDMKFVCHYCDAEFKMRGYLTRHIKKHAIEKAYHCPFWDASLPSEKRCHSTGGFSRRDSYKTHLRSRHFIYPDNVKNVDRVNSHGHCGRCKKHFDSTNEWIEHHIENRECEAILPTFKGNLKKSKKCGKLKMIMTSDGQSRFISNQATISEAKVPISNFMPENRKKLSSEYSKPASASPPIKQTISDLALDNTFALASIPLNYNGNINGNINEHNDNQNYGHFENQVYGNGVPSLAPSNSVPFTGQPQLIPHSGSQNTATHLRKCTQPFDEFSSLNKSPVEDAALDTVRSISSQSSHEHTVLHKEMNFISTDQKSQINPDWEVLPLDIEQAGMSMEEEVKFTNNSNEPKINTTLQRQMNEYALGERHFRETQQFMNFFNYTYNYQE